MWRRTSANWACGNATCTPCRAAGNATCTASGAALRARRRPTSPRPRKRWWTRTATRWNQAFRSSIRQAGRYAQRYRVRGPDGVVRHVQSHWVVKNGADGRPERALGIVMDATEAWNMARTYGETEEKLSLAVDLAHLAVWHNDVRSSRIYFSDTAFDILGMAPQPGRPEPRGTARAGASRRPAAARTRRSKRRCTGGEPVDVETRFRHSNGSWRHLLTRRTLQRDADGAPLAVVGVGLDLTERIAAARQQAELMRQFELTARAAGIGYWSVEAETGVPRWSEQIYLMHGLALDQPAPRMPEWVQRFGHPDERDSVRQRFIDWLKSGQPNLEMEFRILRSDGGVRHVLTHSRVEGPRGRQELFGVALDVTERRLSEAALREASERAALATRGAGLGTWEMDLRDDQAYWDEQMWRLRGRTPAHRDATRRRAPGHAAPRRPLDRTRASCARRLPTTAS